MSDGEDVNSETGALACPVCQSPAKSRCGGCNKVGYCSRDHQRQDWKTHKGNCCSWKICESPELGRYLTAVRDIKPGEVILREKPLLVTPPKVTPAVCLGCYRPFKTEDEEDEDDSQDELCGLVPSKDLTPVPCKECGWPMCGATACANSPDHALECKISEARGGVKIRHFKQVHPMYQAIGTLRALGLQTRDPERFSNLLNLQSHTKERDKNASQKKMEEMSGAGPSTMGTGMDITALKAEVDSDREITVRLIREFFRRGDVTAECVLNLVGVIETNGHEIPIPEPDGQINRRLIGIYHVASFFEHSCKANCVKSWEGSNYSIVIRASVPINKGEHLSIAYVDPLWGTNDRINFLQMSKFFTCTCERCVDPTELGCHVSSLRCQHPKCTNQMDRQTDLTFGLVHPEDPYKPEMMWKCNTCSETYTVGYVQAIVDKVGRDLDAFYPRRGDIEAEEEFLKKNSKVLGPNHFYMLELRVELAQLYGRTPDEPLPMLPPKKLLRKVQLCEELLKVLNVIVPGYNRLRALILYEVQAAVAYLTKMRYSVGEISMETHRNELLQCGKWMSEAIKVLSWERENTVEKKRAEGAIRELCMLKAHLDSMEEPEAEPDFDRDPDKESHIEEVL